MNSISYGMPVQLTAALFCFVISLNQGNSFKHITQRSDKPADSLGSIVAIHGLMVDVSQQINPVLEYLDNAELQFEGDAQKANIFAALKDALNLPVNRLKLKRYSDYTGKKNQWDLPTLFNKHFVPDTGNKTLGENFFRDVKSPKVKTRIIAILKNMSEGKNITNDTKKLK